MVEDVSDERGFPFGMLDPSAPVRFEIDGTQCASLDGFLESLKFENLRDQENIAKFVGSAAKDRGKNKDNPANQKADRTIWWQGRSMKRNSKDFDNLIGRVFRKMAHNQEYQRALMATENSDFAHSKGKSFKKDTLLTRNELTKNLKDLRKELRERFKQGF